MGEVMIYRLLKCYFNAERVSYERNDTQLQMVSLHDQIPQDRQVGQSNGGDYYFLLFIVPLNPFGIQFMSKNRFDCVCFISRFVNKLPSMLPRTRFQYQFVFSTNRFKDGGLFTNGIMGEKYLINIVEKENPAN